VFRQSTVVVAIKEELICCIASDVAEVSSVNVFWEKRLRTLVGRAVHVASLIFTWLPFVATLGKALSVHHNRCNAPPGGIWISQITVPLLWLSAFLHGQQGTLERKFDVWPHFTTGNKGQIVVDASLWGIGGI